MSPGFFIVPPRYVLAMGRDPAKAIATAGQYFYHLLPKAERDQLVPKWHQFERVKHSYSLPYVFTEHGVTMLASVLNSDKAIKMSIAIIKTFVRLRHILSVHKELADKLSELEHKLKKHDEDILIIFEAIKQLMAPPQAKDRIITGFKPKT